MILLPETSWEIKKTKHMGRGIFAKKNISAGTVIGDYLGLVIRSEEEDKYEKDNDLFLMEYHERATIYPDPKEPGIHLINHSCEPNCWMYPYKGHTLYVALRDINVGEELTINYLLEPECCEPPCSHQCVCGTKNCTGTMHNSEENHEKWILRLEEQEKLTKRKRIQYGKFLPKLEYYPQKINI